MRKMYPFDDIIMEKHQTETVHVDGKLLHIFKSRHITGFNKIESS